VLRLLLELFLLRLVVLLRVDFVARFLVLPPVLLRPPAADFLRRVAAPLRAEAEREAFERRADAAPPFLAPFRLELFVLFLPRPEPAFFPPPSSLFTVAQARRSASRRETPRFS
jgi:hypothetical protein